MSSAHHSRRSREREEKELPIGPYTRLRQIGKGSFATVYQGTHTKSKTYVAIKSVDTHKLNKKLRANLRLEIDILKGLYHPHIVALIDCQDRTDQIHLVMEYCALGDLSHFIKGRHTLANHRYTRDMIAKYPNPEGGALNEVIVRHFLKQLSSAIQFLRSRDLMHRDIKPQNLLLCPSPSSYRTGVAQVVPFKGSDESFSPTTGLESLPLLKIADFGFARPLPATSLAETLCGSPLYMAPEILRYEKYDAKADLWSVGAVLYEMVVGKPPFRAGNHVDLLRKIQNTKDRIRFPEENPSSEELKALILALLKLNPIERMNFDDFFANEIITGPIPGAVLSDEPSAPEADAAEPARPASRTRLGSPATPSEDDKQAEPAGYPTARRYSSQQTRVDTPPTSSPMRRAGSTDKPKEPVPTTPPQRPSPVSTTTAPGRQELVDRSNSAAVMERQRSRNTYSGVPQQTDKPSDRTREEERAAQEVAFERDYVVVEKRAVEVNAFADELAHSPRIQGEFARGGQVAVPRRQASQGTPSAAATSPQSTPSKAMQVVPGRTRTDSSHSRQNSYERRYGQSPTSATSAISKALNMATGRLWGVGVGFSPPMTKQGRSPPLAHNPFPVYPVVQGNLRLGDGTKTNVAVDEDTRTVQTIEECASRSDVVYGFAEVKYKQLIPLAPSNEGKQNVPGERISDDSSDGGLTVDAVVTLSEEALVLYVKALSLLAKSMDIAGSWWTRKNRGETYSESVNTSAVAGNRINSVVQWVRARFNEVLEKAEFVRLKLLDGQKRLPLDHPCHPNNNTVGSLLGTAGSGTGSAGTGTGSTGSCGAVDVVLSSGVTAEKLMYDRALELSRGAAISELTGQDLSGCEIAYVTAIHMLEAVLEDDEPRSSSRRGEDARKEGDELDQDRLLMVKLVSSIRSRLAALQKKLAILAKRQAPPSGPSKVPSSNLVSVGATPPK